MLSRPYSRLIVYACISVVAAYFKSVLSLYYLVCLFLANINLSLRRVLLAMLYALYFYFFP